MTTISNSAGLSQLNNLLDEYLVKKAPALPVNIKEAIVKYGPWIDLILLLVTLPALLALFGLGTFLAPFAYLGGVQNGFSFTLGMIFLFISVVIQAVALPGLFKQTRASWNLLYWAALIHAIYSLITFSWINLILGTLISLYILFQIRSYYKA